MSRFGKWPLLVAAMAAVTALLFAAAYSWLVMPRYSQLEQMEQTVQSEKKVLAALKQKLPPSSEETAQTVASLQKKSLSIRLRTSCCSCFRKRNISLTASW
ncbi:MULTISPECIES: hypothetical protein [Geobacillus]|uniref:hypothetical protein n=1 Tax=Geobacillus TaxID=129337 RepID=UPI000AD2B095|nr:MULTISPECIES: hypothetical protein [Geobacillus]